MSCEVSPEVFRAMNMLDIDALANLDDEQVRPLLPTFTRIALCPSLDSSNYWSREKKRLLEIICRFEVTNVILTLLSVDFLALEVQVKKEQQLRSRLMLQNDSSKDKEYTLLDFEYLDGIRRLKLVLSELFAAQASIKSTVGVTSINNPAINSTKSSPASHFKVSQLFDNEMYIDEICDALCIAIAELTSSMSLVEVVETLLYFKEGHRLICRLVANFPESFHEVCIALLHNGDKQEDDTFIGKRRIEIIRLLCKMNPANTSLVRSEAMEAFRMPALCIQLTLDSISIGESESDEQNIQRINELVSFISGIFFGDDEKLRSWFVQYVRNCQKKIDQGNKSSLQPLRTELLNSVEFILRKNSDDSGSLSDFLVEASSILRLYCALRGTAGMKLTEEEASVVLSLVICHPSASPAGIKFASTGLCLLLTCPAVVNNQESERKTLDWLNWLIREESLFGQVAGVRSSFGEMLLLIAIHFHGGQIASISELVSSTLGLKITLRTSSLARLKTLFTQEVFTDQMITAHAVKVPVTPNLNSTLSGFLPVHCIYQLLKSRAFTKYKVPIKEWIYKQILSCSSPLNPVMPPLIEAYVNSVIIPFSKTSAVNAIITEEEILAIFKHKIYSIEEDTDEMEVDEDIKPACMLTSQIILLYYILFYEDVRLNQMKVVLHQNRSVKKYSTNLFSQLPIFYLTQKAKNDPKNYGVIFPRLLRLVATHYPHLCLVQDWLASEERDATVKIKVKTSIKEIRTVLRKSFENIDTNPNMLINTLERTLVLPDNYLWPLASTFIESLPLLLSENIPGEVLEKAKRLWWQLNCIFPDSLCVMTVNSLSCRKFEEKRFTWDEIVFHPLHVLRCDERVFRCPELMEIILHVIRCFLMASRVHYAHHLLERPSKSVEEGKEREDLRLALITAQESAAIQILLECCLPMDEKEKIEGNEKLERIRKLIAVHLHQVFIADPNLAKLVHFQGYSSELLSFTVSSIPSMHICLDFIPELLSQPDIEEQIFAIQTCSYLIKQYPIVKSLCIAKLCFNVANALLPVLESEKRQKFFTPVVPALVRMCEPFPPLKEEAINLLLRLGQISLSRLASTQSDFICTQKALQKAADLEEISWDEAKSFLESLPAVDPLCDIIKKSVKAFE